MLMYIFFHFCDKFIIFIFELFVRTDIYSGVAYNITDIEYEEACILYNIGALHSKLGTMDSRINAEVILYIFFAIFHIYILTDINVLLRLESL